MSPRSNRSGRHSLFRFIGFERREHWELTDKVSEDEKETVMGILVVAFGVAIVSAVFGGALGFLGGAVSAAGLVIILRGER